jgi:hypothetical protein
MPLVLSLSALEHLARPEEAVADARQWNEYVGVTGNTSPDDVTAAVERAGINPDFVSGEAGAAGSLAAIRQRFSTDRHVLLGTGEDDRGISEALGWEYLLIEDAAERAGLKLVDEEHRD